MKSRDKKWTRLELNQRSSLCESDVLTTGLRVLIIAKKIGYKNLFLIILDK